MAEQWNNQRSEDDLKAAQELKTPEQKKSMRDKLGDAVEKVGHKVAEAGSPKLGQKIHDLGDKIEKHHDSADHPHKA